MALKRLWLPSAAALLLMAFGLPTPAAAGEEPWLPKAGYREWIYTKSQFQVARTAARDQEAAQQRSGIADARAGEREALKQEHIKKQRELGYQVSSKEIEYIDLDRDLHFVVPRDLDVEQVKVTQLVEHRGSGSTKEARAITGLEVESSEPVPGRSSLPAGPAGENGIAAPDWAQGSPIFTANYTVKIDGQVTFYTGTEKYKLRDDGSSTRDYFTYYRWGNAQPANSLHLVRQMKLRSYADATTVSNIRYHRWGPTEGATNYCGNINAGLSLVVEFTITFPLECNSITPQTNGTGDYQLNWLVNPTQILSRGRGLEMTNGFAVNNGFNPNTRSWQFVETENYWGSHWTCSSDNTSRTCYP